MKNETTGILITNLGTPNQPTPHAVKKYLAEFLWDPAIVKLPRWFWWGILHGLVLPKRASSSAKLYQKIWTDEGSPLLVHSAKLAQKLQDKVSYKVALGMRYGEPSLLQALQELKSAQVNRVIVLPLYPQFSQVTTQSTTDKILELTQNLQWPVAMECINNYATHPSYISAIVNSILSHWQTHQRARKILFSFHGIPQRQLKKGDPYAEQCHATANAIAKRLGLSAQQWQVVFQSRFGTQKWLQPYCYDVLKMLPTQGYVDVDIICPGFPVDCLETLEEINLTNRNLFLAAGGKEYRYIPALNESDVHVQTLLEVASLPLKKGG